MADDLRGVGERPEDTTTQLTDYVDESNVCDNERPSIMDSSWQAAQSLPNQALKTVLSRSYPIGTISWTSASTRGTNLATLDAVQELTALPQISEKLQWFSYFRFKAVEISIRVNATSFHYGFFTVSALPESSTKSLQLHHFSNNPVIVSASQADVVNYTTDWCWPQRWGEITNDGTGVNCSVQYYLTSLIRLRMAGDTFRPANISLFARFVDPEVSWPRINPTLPLAQGKEGKARAAGSQEDGDSDSFLSSIVKTVDSISNIATVAAPLLALLDKPLNESTQSLVSIMPGRDMALTEGVDNSVPLGRTVDNRITNESVMSDNPAPTAEQIAQKPSYLTSFSWSDSTTYGSEIASIPVSPFRVAAQSNLYYPTYLCWASLPFIYWRGSMKFAFYIASSTFITSRIRVSWIPKESSFSHAYAGDIISKVYDVTGDTTIHFTVPWICDSLYRQETQPYDLILTNQAIDPSDNGKIVISLENVAASASTESTVEAVVFVAAGEDYQLSGYGRHSASTIDIQAYAQSCVWDEFGDSFEPLVDESTFTTYSNLSTPETSNSLLDLMKRYEPYYPPTDVDRTNWAPDSSQNPLPGAQWSQSGAQSRYSIVEWWAFLYEFWKGGRRYKVFYNVDPAQSPTVIPGMFGFSTFQDQDVDPYSFGFDCRPKVLTSTAVGTSQYLEYEFPYFNKYAFSTVTPGNFDVRAEPEYRTSVRFPHNLSAASDFTFAASVADDFQLGWLRNPPRFQWVPALTSSSTGDRSKPTKVAT